MKHTDILPSYNIFGNYHRCVTCASTYIQTFLESDPKGMRWETRHFAFSNYEKEYYKQKDGGRKRGIMQKMQDALKGHDQEIPYVLCGYLCLVLYLIGMVSSYIEESCFVSFSVAQIIANYSLLIDSVLWLAILAISTWIFHKGWDKSMVAKDFFAIWEHVKQEEIENGRSKKEGSEKDEDETSHRHRWI